MQTTPELSHAPAPSTSKRKENTNPQFFFQKKKPNLNPKRQDTKQNPLMSSTKTKSLIHRNNKRV